MVELRLLGPVEVAVDGEPVSLPAKPRTLLAALALEGGVVATDRLVDVLWDDAPPEQAVKTVQVYVSQLRRALGAAHIETVGVGYRLRDVDVDLATWRGAPLADLEPTRWVRAEAARLQELHLNALDERADDELAAGRHAQLVPELERRAVQRPERERVRAQLMLALYRSGRQQEALDVYTRTREELVERFGIEPGPELRELHARVLQQDPALAAPAAFAPFARGRRWWLFSAAATAAAVGIGLAFAFSSGSGADPELRAFAVKVDNFLAQSHDAHREIVATIVAARRCTITPTRAATSLDRVQRSRQSLLQQLAALAVPANADATRSFDLLQRAAQASIAADWRYRDWLRSRKRCVAGATAPASVLKLDRRATELKVAFVDAFRPIARRFELADRSDLDF